MRSPEQARCQQVQKRKYSVQSDDTIFLSFRQLSVVVLVFRRDNLGGHSLCHALLACGE